MGGPPTGTARPVRDPRPAARRELQDLLPSILLLRLALDEPPLHEAVDEPARRRRRSIDRFGELSDGQGAAIGEDVERGELGEPEPQLPELAGKADHQLAPQRPPHGDALADLANVPDATARRKDR